MVRAVAGSGFRYVDLFAGIGGFHLAMDALGGQCVMASEIDAACQDVYEDNFGLRPEGDIQPLTEGRRIMVPPHDVLCGGFPCQPFSKSGHQLGINEARGTLFFNILRILEACRPRFVVLENVRNLAGPRQRDTWNTIIRSLRSLGYRVSDRPVVFSPHLLPPRLAGAPQIRDRVFVLGERVVSRDQQLLDVPPLVANEPVDAWDPSAWRVESILDSDEEIAEVDRYSLRPDEVHWINAWTDFVQRIKDEPLPGFPIWADAFRTRVRVTSDTPGWKSNFLKKNADLYRRHQREIDRWMKRWGVDGFPPSRRKLEWQARGWPRDLWQLVMHMRPSGIRVKPPTYLPALVAITQTSIIGSRRRRLTPREAARLQSFPEDFRLHPVDAVAYKQLGNAVNVGAVMHVTRALLDGSFGVESARPRSTARQRLLDLHT